MDGKIISSEGEYVAYIQANGIYDLAGKKLYDLKGQKIYKTTGELVGNLSMSTGDRRLDKYTDRLFREAK
jgi:tricorn protease-like protein